ncbi:DUF6266 family protein [Myroides sp. N17-2]|uniref:DUF6266 family protein n=1 Tax=Myroides sp. N17-2 TaxID=2030799 RepID=UPI000EFBF7EB|nr:DUF6266 family protein [Myroides sp. N17-2]
MAEIKQGILGPVNGKVGTVVGATWRGVNYIRAKPRKSRKKPSMKQLLQWDKMSLVSTFASKFKDFVNTNCPNVYNGKKWITGKEQMISRLMTQGINLINGEQHIKVEEALLSIGNLAPAVIKKINRLKTGKFKVQWENGLVNALTLNTDQLTMMLYNETLDQFIAIANVGNRIDKYAHFSIPTDWDKGTVYFWSMWKAADGSVTSTSCFHGIIELDNIEEEIENGEQKTKIREKEQETGNGELEAEKKEQEAENRNQEISEVIPIEQAREIALKQHLEEIDTSTEVEITPSLKEDTIPPLNQQQKDGETTAPPINTSEDKKVKRWTPPGYIRKVNKKIIKQAKTSENELQTDQMDQKTNNEPRSILEFNSITEEQRE